MSEDDDDDRPFGGDTYKYLTEVCNRLQVMMSLKSDGTYEIPLSFREHPTEVSHRHPFKKAAEGYNVAHMNKVQHGVQSKMEPHQKLLISSTNTLDQGIEHSKSIVKPNTRIETGADLLDGKGKIPHTNTGDSTRDTGADQSVKQGSMIPNKDVKKEAHPALKKSESQTRRNQLPDQSNKQGITIPNKEVKKDVPPAVKKLESQTPRKDILPQTQSQKKDEVKKKDENNMAQKKDQSNKKSKPV